MIYKPFGEHELSTLGFGAMRLPKVEGQGEKIDVEKAVALIQRAHEQGINYFDTAYRYHAGESEIVLAQALKKFPRESYHITSKMPGHMMTYKDGQYEFFGLLAGRPSKSPAEIFEEQLEKMQLGYFDFYLLHNLCEQAYDFYTNPEVGVVEYLVEQQKKGRIRQLGFSCHGRADCIEKFLQKYPGVFTFAQIQLNYMDWTLQDAKRKYDVLTKHNIPVVVMEPARGGRLCTLGEAGDAMLKEARPNDTVVSWAFRFLQSLPNVQVVLSGMSNFEQLDENVETFSKQEPVTDEERALLDRAIAPLLTMVPCTACRYCCEACPQELDIPKLISLYNETSGADIPLAFAQVGFVTSGMKPEELPEACIGCGACSQLCPQSIDIPDVMRKYVAKRAELKK